MLKVSLLSEVLLFPRSRKLCLDSRLFSSIPSLHYNLFPSAISLSRGSIDQIFHYQNKSGYISKPDYRVFFSYSGVGNEMLCEETDEHQLV